MLARGADALSTSTLTPRVDSHTQPAAYPRFLRSRAAGDRMPGNLVHLRDPASSRSARAA
jgi:hypothetical protein